MTVSDGRRKMWLVRSLGSRSAAFLLSLIGHALLAFGLLTIQPLERARPLPIVGVSVPGSGFLMDRSTVIFIEEEATATKVDRPAPPTLELAGLLPLRVQPLQPELPDISELEDASGTANAAEPTEIEGNDATALLARYVGLIRARIERAWDRPHSNTLVQCRVQIIGRMWIPCVRALLALALFSIPLTAFAAAGRTSTQYSASQSGEEDMLALERRLHERLPIGPEEGQSFYIKIQERLGLTPPPYQ